MTPDVDTIVIGGGVVGLAIGRALAKAGGEVLLLERHEATGTEASSRNSEVVHAGLYYPPTSLRAHLCVQGRRMLYAYAEERGIPYRRCGKLVVATSTAEIPHLKLLKANAGRSGVDDILELTGHEVRAMEPEVHCVAALLSPSSGIIDSHALMGSLEGDLTDNRGQVVLNTQVDRLLRPGELFKIETSEGGRPYTVTCRRVVIAAGLDSSRLARGLYYPRHYDVPRTYPAKGHYFAYSGINPFNHLIYPMPSGAWLGVHATIDLGNQLRFGPDNQWVERVDYGFDTEGGARKQRFEQAIRLYWPNMPENAIHPDYVAFAPRSIRKGSRLPISGSTVRRPMAFRDLSPSTASRAPGSPPPWPSLTMSPPCSSRGRPPRCTKRNPLAD
ncbi:L-2-hydroxyglutarate oxidase LhgO [Methyloligella halotolerans]|uniref:L-2-hydroxyglutarate oxidase LhgO n=1 Tax=Methyloligella halotolerans TaxID=1177755 RepID=A0A1E2S2M6_9HYPH|nr:L-2-hydroxyglutarate oxidase LhgO [Methyloligella halotolerans]